MKVNKIRIHISKNFYDPDNSWSDVEKDILEKLYDSESLIIKIVEHIYIPDPEEDYEYLGEYIFALIDNTEVSFLDNTISHKIIFFDDYIPILSLRELKDIIDDILIDTNHPEYKNVISGIKEYFKNYTGEIIIINEINK